MNKIAEIRFPNLINNSMLHTSASTPTNMTSESLNAMIEPYCELFKITFKIIEYNGNISTDIDLTGELDQASLSSNNQPQQQESCVFIVYNNEQQSVAPLYVCQDDGNVKLFLERYEAEIIEQKVLVSLKNGSSYGKIKIFNVHVLNIMTFLKNIKTQQLLSTILLTVRTLLCRTINNSLWIILI